MKPSLIFWMSLPDSPVSEMVEGIMKLVDLSVNSNGAAYLVNSYRFSSSRPNHQYWGSWRVKSGLIPPDEPWQVATTPINMPNNPGVGGLFFPVTPFQIQTIRDIRGDFGVHKDANRATAPGSLGCPFPIAEAGWEAVKRDLLDLGKIGIKKVPMQVHYTHN